MLNLSDLTTPPPSPKKSGKKPELLVEDSASAKQSREMILQTKLIVVELLQVNLKKKIFLKL